MSAAGKRKIAILGGGVGAMAAAWSLTCEPGWEERYEITVYQMGWRLGGKGASGRRGPHARIEEHGLHVWLGFYHNAFNMLQEAFAVINPAAPEAPVDTEPPRIANGMFMRCEDAFKRHSYVGVYDEANGRSAPWMTKMPRNERKPWEGGGSRWSLWDYIRALAAFIGRRPEDHDARLVFANEDVKAHAQKRAWLQQNAAHLQMEGAEPDAVGRTLVAWLDKAVRQLPEDPAAQDPADRELVLEIEQQLQEWTAHEFRRHTVHTRAGRRELLLLDMSLAILRGLGRAIWGGVPFDQLDDEFRTWLRANRALPETCTLAENPFLRGVYDFVFAFRDGDTNDPERTADFATAPALRTILRMCFTYDGAIFWKMRAGMGDTIFAPLYLALKARGVQFKFFHRVKALRLSSDRRSIERIEVTRQVTTRAGYQPLIEVKGLACWPSEPDYDQIEEGARLRAEVERQDLDLESMWFQWTDAEPSITLQKGCDFDTVVFGISLGSVPFLCDELCAANEAWRDMVQNVKTVCTSGFQLWLKPDLTGLGWTKPSPIIDAFHEPLDTWADLTHLKGREDWPGEGPGAIAYFCGPLASGPLNPGTGNGHVPGQAKAQASADIANLLARLPKLWPEFKASQIVDRFQRVNIDPSERYVMSVANSTRYRIKADASGFDNLILTGDWIDNGFNAGCVEASVMAGIQAANAVLGRNRDQGVMGSELS